MEREIKLEEYNLLKCMLNDVKEYEFNIEDLTVIEMLDGGMGSLYIMSASKSIEERKMSKSILEKQFFDVDNMPISVSVNIDTDGNLFELDIWRVDFNPIIRFPIC
jgi:hypothetical protein